MTAPDGADDSPAWLRAALRPFPDQTPVQHLLVAATGLAVWSAAFLAALSILGGVSVATADSVAAIEARRIAGVLAGVGCGGYLGVAFARERGGPVTNLLFAPLSAAVGVTGAPIAAVYGTAPAGVFSPATVTGIAAVGGGVGTAVVLASATVVAVLVAAGHLAVLAGPAQRRRVETRFAELPGVHFGPRPIEDWRQEDRGRTDGGRERVEQDAGGTERDGGAGR